MRRGLANAFDWLSSNGAAIWTWVLGFGLVAYLGLNGGGFDPLIHDQVGVAVWWIVPATVLVGALPRKRPGSLAWSALGLLAALVAWTALSLGWTESPDGTWEDIAYVATYLGVFVLAVLSRGARSARQTVGAVGAGIALVSAIALLSRLHPAWFPEASQTARLLSGGEERLAYPLHYWNALAGLIAIGLPLLLQVATCARSILLRALAAAALPAMALASFLTFSRGGMAAAIVAIAVFLTLTSDRLPKLLTLLTAGAGTAILVIATAQRDAIRDGLLNQAARDQGNEILAMTIVICVAVGLIQAGTSLAFSDRARPRWTELSRRRSRSLALAALLGLLVAAAAVDIPSRTANAWAEFKGREGAGEGAGRLTSTAGQGRYRYWSVGVEQFRSQPLTGTGAGTFEHWWAREGDAGAAHDTHSLYLQTLGELGIAGLALLAALLLTILLGGGKSTLGASRRGRPQLAAALAGCVAFCLTAAYDWTWQIPVLPIAMLLLAAVLVTANAPRRQEGGAAFGPLPRLGLALAAVVAIIAIAIPLASKSSIRQSEERAREGNLEGALHAAQSAQNVQPGTAAPRLQKALVFEVMGELSRAAVAARQATESERTNWRNWLVLSRIEAKRGRAATAVRYYRSARSLNPRSPLFER